VRPHAAANLRRYARVAPLYDLLDRVLERRYRPGRALVGTHAAGLTVEVGAGTGKYFPYYTPRARVFASDLSRAMLARARAKFRPPVRALLVAEATALPFRDDSADAIVATFVCCVQDDPRPSLREMARVLKPGGRALCLDYTVPNSAPLRLLMRSVQPILHLVYGIHWDHDVPRLLEGAGLTVREVRNLWGPVVRYIAAEKPLPPASLDPAFGWTMPREQGPRGAPAFRR
jgi:phosphatidylethanolamine/phosphatidyl-N-methylethanolamine N-methyltransferase